MSGRGTLMALALALVLVQQASAQPAAPQVPDAAQFVGAPRGSALSGQALEARTNQIAALLRCPVCQGMAVADSPAEMAVNMKGQVRELLSRGYTEKQILQYFERSYGEFVLLKPKFEGINQLVWLLPVVAMVIGIAIVALKIRSLEKGAAPSPPKSEAEDPYLAQVRELVGRRSE